MNFFRFFSLLFFILFAQILKAQQSPINGPMLGYNSDTETVLWIQTKQAAKVAIEYYPVNSPNNKQKSGDVLTQAEDAFVAKIAIKNLQAATDYAYIVYLDDKAITFETPNVFHTQSLDNEHDFSVATGSCACLRDKSSKSKKSRYNVASGYHIYKSIAHQHPDYMVWLGDNIYLRNGEWQSKEGVCYRYTHTRSLPQMQPLLRNTHHIATWDDHDYGANNGNLYSKSKDFALDGFNLFWANPETHPKNESGIYFNYRIADAEFFMTDDRYFRVPDTAKDDGNKHFLGKNQLEWLLNGLEKSDANFKIVAIGTQLLNPNEEPRKESYWRSYRKEAEYLLAEIKRRKINGVLFLTGDVHYTMLSRMDSKDFYPFYDLTVSAFTSIQNPFFGTKNPLKVKGTFLWEHNYALLKFSGKGENRSLNMEVRNKFGIRKWKKSIMAKELKVG